ncbi:MAG: hypothetical protein RIT17_837, partial [Pseudomonadota bacterium]
MGGAVAETAPPLSCVNQSLGRISWGLKIVRLGRITMIATPISAMVPPMIRG